MKNHRVKTNIAKTGVDIKKITQQLLGLRSSSVEARALNLFELEDRILLSATPLGAVAVPQAEQSAGLLIDSVSDTITDSTESIPLEETQFNVSAVSRELVFVDPATENYQQLLDDLWSAKDPNRELDVILLSGQRSGIEQISEALAQYTDEKLDAVHFVSHGTDGGIKLGNSWLNQSSFELNKVLISAWSHSLNAEADLLFYGCDLASSDTGQTLLSDIAESTGADLAASINDTGAVLLGGDWKLEHQIGEVETAVAFSETLQSSWFSTLELVAASGERLVNTATPEDQIATPFGGGNVDMNSSGRYVVAWEDFRSGNADSYAKVFNADGTVLTAEFRVHAANFNHQDWTNVAMADNDNFVVTWSDDRSGGYEVYMRLFSVNGTALTGETLVSTLPGVQDAHSVDFAADGSYVIAFQNASNTDIYFQRYDASGVALGSNTKVNAYVTNEQNHPDVAVNDDGSFVVTWMSDAQDTNLYGIYGQRFDAAGNKVGLEFLVNQNVSGNQWYATVDSDSSGNFVVTWMDNDTNGNGIWARRFDASANPLGNAFLVNSWIQGDQGSPNVAVNDGGDFVISWHDSSGHDGTGFGIYAQQYDASGNTIGGEVLINQTTSNDQRDPTVAINGNQAVAAWSGNGTQSGQTDASGVFVRQFNLTGIGPQTFTVTNTLDDGSVGSLRWAITQSNASIGIQDTIDFAIGTGTQTISLLSALPTVTDSVVIDAWTQSGFTGTPRIIVDANGISGDGFRLTGTADNSTIRGFVIRDFVGDGIQIDSGSTGNTIEGNYIGAFNATGTDLGAAEQNIGYGINLLGSENTIGGTTVQSRNVIGGNQLTGVYISGIGATNNTLLGNYIGVDATGAAAIANDYGINIADASGTIIGNGTVGGRNIIAGNTNQGILLWNADSTTIQGNYVGTNAAGTGDLNGSAQNGAQSGIVVGGSTTDVLIGGNSAGQGNVISGNNWFGIEFWSGTTDSYVQGNYIGTDATGLVDLGNSIGGVTMWGSGTGIIVGGGTAAHRNIISGNDWAGVSIGNAAAAALVQGNYIGLGVDGSTIVGNQAGVVVEGGSAGSTIGTNWDFSNDAGERNVISGNQTGILIQGSGTTGTLVWGNYIGTDATGLLDRGNTGDGILIQNGATGTQIAGTSTKRNIIAGNDGDGIHIEGETTDGTFIQNNYIGLGSDGLTVLGNAAVGINMTGGADNTKIGGMGLGNVIVGSGYNGIEINGASSGTSINANFIGVNAAGTVTAGNQQHGIQLINGVSNTLIGGTAAGAGNIVTDNGLDGISLTSSTGSGNSILGNRIYSNGSTIDDLAIDLIDDGVTDNDSSGNPEDQDSGPNNLQNFPELFTATIMGADLDIAGRLSTDGLNTPYRIEFYNNPIGKEDPSGHGEARVYLGSVVVTTDVDGRVDFTTTLSGVSVVVGDRISATATRVENPLQIGIDDAAAYGSTSEMSLNLPVASGMTGPSQSLPAAQSISEDNTLTFSAAGGNPITVDDGTASTTALLQVSINVPVGTLTLSQTTGLSFPGGANGSGGMVLWGTEADINAALEGLIYSPTANYNGPANISITTTLGHNLQGLYEFESAGDVGEDTSVGVLETGVLVGTATLPGPNVVIDATRGNVLSLDGADDSIQISGRFGNAANVTLATWVNLTNANTNGSHVLNLGNSIALGVDRPNNGEGVQGYFWDGTTWQAAASGQFIEGTGWHHIAYVFDDVANTQTLYIDGLQAAQTTLAASISYSLNPDTFIGANPSGSNLFDFQGRIDDTRVYTRALSAAEVAAIANDSHTATGTIAVTVTPDNDAPVLTAGGTRAVPEGNDALPFYSESSVTDVDNANFNGGTLTATITGGFEANDELFLTGGGIAGVTIVGSDVLVSGTTIGTWSGGTSGTPLVITFNPNSQIIKVDTLLNVVTYRNTSENPTSSTRTISLVVNDGSGGTSNVASATVVLTAVNDTPDFSNLNGTPTYTEGGAFVVLDGDVTIYDGELSDNDNFEGAEFTLARNGGANPEDQLAFDGITVTTSGANVFVSGVQVGTYTFTGGQLMVTFNANATQTRVDSLLQNIVYANSSESPPSNVQLDWTFNDHNTGLQGTGGMRQTTGSTNVNITAVNDAPVVTMAGGTQTYTENSPPIILDATTLISDVDSTDFDGGTLTVSIVSGGTLDDRLAILHTGSGPGEIGVAGNDVLFQGVVIGTFTGGTSHLDPLVITFNNDASPASAQVLARNITWEVLGENPTTTQRLIRMVVTDGDGGTSNNGQNLYNVVRVNDAPVAVAESYTINEDSTLTVAIPGVLSNDTDVDGDVLQAAAVTLPSHAATFNFTTSGNIVYTPVANFTGIDTFTYLATDGNLGSNIVTVAISVTAVNDAPVIGTNTVTISEGATVVLSNANINSTDPDNTAPQLTYTASVITGGQFELVATPGVAITSFTQQQINDGDIQFVHNGGEAAPVYSLTVSDGALSNGPSNPTISFTNVNDAPVTGNGNSFDILTDEDTPTVAISVNDILANVAWSDADQGALKGIAITGLSSINGAWQFSSDGLLWSSLGSPSVTASLLLDSNSFVRFVPNGNGGGTSTFGFVAWDQTDGGVPSTSDTPNYGNATVRSGETAFSDGFRAVRVTVSDVNDTPTISMIPNQSVDEDTVLGPLNFTVGDLDTAASSLVVTASSSDQALFNDANLIITGTGANRSITLTPEWNVNGGPVTIKISVSDGTTSSETTFDVIVNAVNDAPFQNGIDALVFAEGEGVTLSAGAWGDFDGGPLTYEWDLDGDGNFGDASGSSPVLSWAALQSFGINDDGNYNLAIRANDGNGGIGNGVMLLQVTNKAPTAYDDSGVGFATDEDSLLTTIDTRGNDSDPSAVDVLSISSIDTTGTLGIVINNGDGTFSYNPNGMFESLNAGETATDSFTYTLTDDDGGTDTATVSITITGVNDAPEIVLNTLTISEGESVVLTTAQLSATDVDNSEIDLTFTVSTISGGQFEATGSQGVAITSFTLEDVKNSAVQFVHDGNEAAPAYSLTLSDGTLSAGPSTAIIDFTNQNDAPVITSGNVIVSEGTFTAGTITSFDVDGGFPRYYLVGGADQARFSLDPGTGLLSFVNSSEFEFPADTNGDNIYEIRVQVNDGNLGVMEQDVTVSVTDLNDTPPVITPNQQFSIAENSAVSTSLGTVLASDVDTVGSFQNWQIQSGNNDNIFVIDSLSGEITVGNNALLNYEHQTSYTLVVTVSDGVTTSAAETLQITVTNVNEQPHELTLTGGFVDENSLPGTAVGSIASQDADAGDTANYTLLNDANGRFQIGLTSGFITVLDGTQLNFESNNSHQIRVQVQDAAGLTYYEDFTITLNDLNEAPTLTAANFSLNEHTPLGTFVFAVGASDPDALDNLTFRIVSGNTGGIFTIDPATGDIRVVNRTPLVYEQTPTMTLTIEVSDKALLADTATVDVTVININDAPLAGSDQQYQVRQFEVLTIANPGLTLGTTDIDGDVITPVIVSGPTHGILTVNPDGSFAYDSIDLFFGEETITFVLSDGLENSSLVTMTIEVEALAPNPVVPIENPEPTPDPELPTDPENETQDPNTSQTDSVPVIMPIQATTKSLTVQPLQGASSINEIKDIETDDSNVITEIMDQTITMIARSLGVSVPDERSKGGRFIDVETRDSKPVVDSVKDQAMIFLAQTSFWESLDSLKQDLGNATEDQQTFETVVVGTTAAMTGSLTVGYVLWLIRGGSLVATMISVMPTWTAFDPLPVLDRFQEVSKEDEDQEDLVSLIVGTK